MNGKQKTIQQIANSLAFAGGCIDYLLSILAELGVQPTNDPYYFEPHNNASDIHGESDYIHYSDDDIRIAEFVTKNLPREKNPWTDPDYDTGPLRRYLASFGKL